MNPLTFIIFAMLFQQALSYMATQVLPNMAPAVGAAIGTDPGLIGFHTGLVFLASSIWQLSCGSFIIRYGALRMSQVSLLIIGVGLLIGVLGNLPILALAAIIIGTGNSFSTPASSHLLARYSPPKYAPLIFSVKQTGVPVGGLMAGMLIPWALAAYDWRAGFVAAAVICIAFAIMLQPFRERFDFDRVKDFSLRTADIFANLHFVLRTPALRDLALSMFAFVGLQGMFGAYFVTFGTEAVGLTIDSANRAYAVGMTTAIAARIFWGWVGSALVGPRAVLAGLAFAMAAASAATGFASPAWGYTGLMLVSVLFCCTAISWHGVLLAEVARLAPPGKVGPTTGGVLFFGGSGMMTYPVVYVVLLKLTESYALGFFLAAIPAAFMGLRLLRKLPPSPPQT